MSHAGVRVSHTIFCYDMTPSLAVPSTQSLLWPAIVALRSLGGSASHQELVDKVVEEQEISEAAQSVMHAPAAGWTKVNYNLCVAKIILGKGGLIETGKAAKGMWILTEKGAAVSEPDLSAVLQESRSRNALKPDEMTVAAGDPPDSGVGAAWRNRLLEVLMTMPPPAFERLAQRLLREAGFVKVEVTGKCGDGGIDGVGVVRLQGLLSFHVHFQCKRYKDTVGSGAIRDFRGAMVGRSDKGLFITTGTFTAEAKKEATRDGAPPIDLIDGQRLCDLLKELGLGVQTQLIEEVTVDSGWFERI